MTQSFNADSVLPLVGLNWVVFASVLLGCTIMVWVHGLWIFVKSQAKAQAGCLVGLFALQTDFRLA